MCQFVRSAVTKGWLCRYAAVWAVILTVIAAGAASAQLAGTGAIAGTVMDPSGAVVPNAQVVALATGTNVETVRTTTKSGDFNITPLTPGPYVVTVSAPGFQGYRQENVSVDALATVTLNINLSIGKADQTVTVTSAPPLLSTEDASLGAVMDNEMYSNLPIMMGAQGNNDQRRATDFAYLMPGVQSNFTSNNVTSSTGIVNGSGPAGGVQEVYIEGVNLPTADQVGDPRFTWTAIGVDAVDQFQVQTAGYSAQYAGQGVQNYSIKSGTNAFHGSIYEYLRNTIFDAWQFTSKVPTLNSKGQTVPGGIKPREIQNEFGIVLSGPIVKNKLFLFGNYGQYRNQNGAKYSPITMPTLAMMGYDANGNPMPYADFSGYAAANGGAHIYDPSTQTPNCSNCTRQQFTYTPVNGVPQADAIPISRISAASQYYNKFLLPYEALTNQTAYTNNLTYGTPTGLANWYETAKIDYAQSSRNQLDVVIGFGRQASTGPNSASGLGAPFNTSQSYHPVTTVDILRDAFTINSHLVNQFMLGFGRYQSLSVTPNLAQQYAASTAGILNMPAGQAHDGFPGISWSGSNSNPPTWGGYAWNNKINNTYNVTDNLQWIFGKHNFTFGGQFVDQQFNFYKVTSPSGPMAFTFSAAQTGQFSSGTTISASTGSSFASYLLGAASAGSTSANVPGLGTRWRDPSFWAQDDFKVNTKLTLNMGLRWDIFPSITEAHNLFTWLNPNGINSITGNRGTLYFAGSGNPEQYCNCSTPSSTYYKHLAPRLGMAYSVTPKTVIRGSFNVIFARGDWTSGSQSGSPSTLGLTPSASAPSGISGAPAFYWDATNCTNGQRDGVACGWNGSVTPPTPPAGGTSLAEYATTYTSVLGNSGSATVTYFDGYRGSRTPEYENWTFGVQRQITRDMSATVSYVGSQGHFVSGGYQNPDRTNHLRENYAALAGYNFNSSTGVATPCSGTACGYGANVLTLLGAKSTAAALAAAQAVGFTPQNPYTKATYYASNTVAQYYYPFPQYSGVTDTTNFNGNTAYHALQISIRQRAAHGLDFMINYTYSKAIDDVGTFRVYDNPRLDRSLSTTDQPQNLTATAVYQLPFGHGKIGGDNYWANVFGGGWSLSGIFSYHSGTPLLATGSGCGGSGILGTCMPSLVPGVAVRQNAYGQNVTASPTSANYYGKVQYLNPDAFSVSQPGTAPSKGTTGEAGTTCSTTSAQTQCKTGDISYVGNGPALYVPGTAPRVGAGNVWSMSYYDLDMGLKRVFPIYENLKLQFEADLSNVTNHVVWGSLNGGVAGSSFGFVGTPVSSPRDAQFAIRLLW